MQLKDDKESHLRSAFSRFIADYTASYLNLATPTRSRTVSGYRLKYRLRLPRRPPCLGVWLGRECYIRAAYLGARLPWHGGRRFNKKVGEKVDGNSRI